jgi:hypothetical protein
MRERRSDRRLILRRLCAGVTLGVLVAAGSLGLQAAELVDRVLAVVSGTVITLSDARVALTFKVVDTTGAADPVAVALHWLIDRQLVLDEMSRYDTGTVEPSRVDASLAAIRGRYATDQAFARALETLGLDQASARRWLEDTLRTQEYLVRRFDTILLPTDEELQAYYTRNLGRFARNGVAPPLDEIRAEVAGALRREQQQEAVASWLTRLRRRADVNELYLPVR